ELGAQGKTVLISSHILSELEAVCNKVAVIEGGRVRYQGDARSIAAQLGALSVSVQLLDEAAAGRARELVEKVPRVAALRVERDTLRFGPGGGRWALPPIHRALVQAEIPVVSFEVAAPGLEQLFLRVTEGTVS